MTITSPESLARLQHLLADELAVRGVHDSASSSFDQTARVAREVLGNLVEDEVAEMVRRREPVPTAAEEAQAIDDVVAMVCGLGSITRHLSDPKVENVLVNGCDDVWIVRADGSKVRADPVCDTDEELIEIIQRAGRLSQNGERRFDGSVCRIQLQLPGGHRLFGLREVSKRPCLAIRKHRFMDTNLDELLELSMMTPEVADFLECAALLRKNTVIAGPNDAGKTTLLRAICAAIPAHERLLTVEEDYELGLEHSGRHPDLVPLQERQDNAEGVGAYPVAQLVRDSLRMTPDRVIVGEVRGAEAVPMLNAMSQGRAGSLCTMHADSSDIVFTRLASYIMQAPERLGWDAANVLIASAVHFVVYIHVVDERVGIAETGETASGLTKRRYIASIREVSGLTDNLRIASNEIFRPGPGGLGIAHAPLRPETAEAFSSIGYHHRVEAGPEGRQL